MATGGKITNDGANLVLLRAYTDISPPVDSRISRFKIGTGLTTPTVSDTDVEIKIPFTGTETIDDCETANWTEGSAGGVEVLNSSTFKEGTYSLELPKDGTNILATWEKTTTNLDGTDKTLFMWFYIKDATALAKLATTGCLVLRLGSDSSNYYYLSIDAASLATGWNLSTSLISSMNTTGTPVTTALDYSQIRITTTNAADTFTTDDIIMDYWHLASNDDFIKAISSGGETTFDEANKRVEMRCFVSSIEANGYLLSEVGAFNTDGTPLMDSHDVYTAISKNTTDEIVYLITHELDNS